MATFNLVVTNAGLAAAWNVENTGIELEITHVGFGTGSYDPDGTETALANQVKLVAIAGGQPVTPSQIRVSAVWQSETDNYPISEIGIFADSLLVAVWSRISGDPLGYKTPGVDFIFNYDWLLTVVPPGSIIVSADTGQSAILAMLSDHESDPDAHGQYLKRKRVIWCGEAAGTDNALELTVAAEDAFEALELGQRFQFQATLDNTGAVTAEIGEFEVNVTKAGDIALDAGDIATGAIYELVWDGVNAQITGGIGANSSNLIEPYEFTATADQDTFSVVYSPGNITVYVNGSALPPSEYTATNGTTIVLDTALDAGDEVLVEVYRTFGLANAVALTGDQSVAGVKTFSSSPIVPTPTLGDNTTKVATTAFVQAAITNGSATESAAGVVEFADATEIALAGSGSGALDRAVSVGRLALLQATLTARGLVELATTTEALGSSAALAVTPAGLDARKASQAQVDAGTDAVRYVTPEALKAHLQAKALLPVGMISDMGALTAPAGWLFCDGSAQSRATYPDLFAAIVKSSVVTISIATPGVVTWASHPLQNGYPVKFSTTSALPTGIVAGTTYYVVNKAANTFQISATAGGSAITTSGTQSGAHTAICAPFGDGNGTTTFNLPDQRGEFRRGWDAGRGIDANRIFGSAQDDAFEAHTHGIGTFNDVDGSGSSAYYSAEGGPVQSGSTGGSETRPRNIALPVYIKAYDALVNQSLIDVAALAASIPGLVRGTSLGSITLAGADDEWLTIPAGAEKIEICGKGISLSSTDGIALQLGGSSYVTSGYNGSITGATSAAWSTQAVLQAATVAAGTYAVHATMTKDPDSNVWHITGRACRDDGTASTVENFTGSVNVAAALAKIKIKSTAAATFDAGTAFVKYW